MPGQNLTRAEAAERATLVSTREYHVTLDLSGAADSSKATFRSTTTALFSATPGA